MKTTLDLPDELMRAVEVRAAEENLELREFVTNLLRLGLAAASAEKPMVRNRVQFPLVQCAHPAKPGDELTPERVAERQRRFPILVLCDSNVRLALVLSDHQHHRVVRD